MSTALKLIETKQFGDVVFNCYQDESYDGTGGIGIEFWATREQIGQLLDYSDPDASIRAIHSRNKDRLDQLSTRIILNRVEGDRTVTREVTVYSFKGLLEICRYSNQPKADAVMDFLYQIADEIRKTGSYTSKSHEHLALPDGVLEGAKLIFEVSGLQGNQLALALDNVYLHYTNESALGIGKVQLVDVVQQQLMTPTQLGKELERVYDNQRFTAVMVNKLLFLMQYQKPVADKWEPTDLGKAQGGIMINTGKNHKDGTPVNQLKWYSKVVPPMLEYLNLHGLESTVSTLKALAVK